jgi:type IV pilus assembly protein PilY1
MIFKKIYASCAIAFAMAAGALIANTAHAVTIPSEPLTIQASAVPLIMLAFGRDHRMFYEAYNDSSDIDGDGTLDIRFKPFITYLGLFDSNLCYSHNNSNSNTGLFTPSVAASDASYTAGGKTYTVKNCPGAWSGNWLNYITTSRIDALRVVLYGGTREVDSATQTVLRRSYIPQDAHSWAKEYFSEAYDGYKISDYTPLAQPSANLRHFFGNLTANASTNCGTLSNCSNLPPWLSVVTNSPVRVWEWASTERPVLSATTASPVNHVDNNTTKPIRNQIGVGAIRTDYTVRVEICTASFRNSDCKLYPNGNYKPVGLLHDFGEKDEAYFGMFSGIFLVGA